MVHAPGSIIMARVFSSLLAGPDLRQPVNLAHIDQWFKASVNGVHRHLPAEEVPELLKHRFQIINLWRPIGNPALDWPLALCDYRNVRLDKDTFPVALIYPDREGEAMGFSADSVRDGSVAAFTPHTGFQDSTTPKDAPSRASIEVDGHWFSMCLT
ncbi:hypothetical protein NP233_g10631 [Leucocoprinus birnbaumii]|uniref:Uncharacterized protein n=1 Tax=Leucocoprinus birnbaumii TaxID=56174 RepID=A0AAD5YRP3_9AGAR|nr:hypothetical protein NP233_g10631 [Leucocoprinus birnbaumii]